MAKIKHPDQVDTIDDLISDIINKGIAHIGIENESVNGRILQINNKECLNFGSYSYLGLELHPKLKEGAVLAAQKYGTQFPSSRVYLSIPLYMELEQLMSRIFHYPVIVAPSTTLAHLSLIPAMVKPDDLIILDHQVHYTVQNPVNICKARGTKSIMIRHNRMDILEDTIKENMDKHGKVWYMADGIYSMFGDVIPLDDIVYLLNKYQNFHVYIDDAHGMSWSGRHGRGWVLNHMEMHPKMILALSLSKGFGSGGGVLVFPDEETKRRVSTVGGSLIFSGPMSPPEIGAAVASAKIHLSDEIYELQAKLKDNIKYFNELLGRTDLPLVDVNGCPIFYIGMGLPRVGQNMVKKLIDGGFYVNIGMFPAVPMRCSGVRISMTTHTNKDDIEKLVDALSDYFPKVMKEENYSFDKICADFRGLIKPKISQCNKTKKSLSGDTEKFTVQYSNSIGEINKPLWNDLLGDNGIFDYEGLRFLEHTFTGNEDENNNWRFHYFMIFNKDKKPIVATFFTECIWKDDMLAPASVSKEIEEKRKTDPFYLTSRTITMGTMISEGKHLYIDKDNDDWKEALEIMLDRVNDIKNEVGATQVVLRDFKENDEIIKTFLIEQGFIKVSLPDTNIINQMNWSGQETFLSSLTKNSRKTVKKSILEKEHLFEVTIENEISKMELDFVYDLFMNVQSSNLSLNLFALPKNIFHQICMNENWELINLRIKEENNKIVASCICYKSSNNYIPLFAGLDYKYLQSHSNYRQLLYQVVKRAKQLGKQKIYFGLTASIEKRRLGAFSVPQVVYMQSDDNYKLEKISNMSSIRN